MSVIVPVVDEADELPGALASLGPDACEVIVVDGGSVDDSVQVARRLGATVLTSSPGRAAQMNAGAHHATGDALLFLHADTRLPSDWSRHVAATLARRDVAAGAFRLTIDGPGLRLRGIAAVANLRSRWLGLPYGDQALFVRRAAFDEVGGFPEIAACEDVALVRRLGRLGNVRLAPGSVRTSARRWLARGPLRQSATHVAALGGHLVGVDPDRIARWCRPGGP